MADRFDLRRDIQFSSRVDRGAFGEEARCWDVTLEDGSRYASRFLITAIGPLSAPTMPRIPGVEISRARPSTPLAGRMSR